MSDNWKKILIAVISILGLMALYLLQRTNYAGVVGIRGATAVYVFNKSFRFIFNDLFMLGLIYAIFVQQRFVRFAIFIQVFGFVFLLIPYFILKLQFHANNGPLTSFLHRLVLNPTLMILLIPAFWFQLRNEKRLANGS